RSATGLTNLLDGVVVPQKARSLWTCPLQKVLPEHTARRQDIHLISLVVSRGTLQAWFYISD
ncbi:MAG TPA: hypothetical protein VFP59_00480, partial [Candidatus Angelobacter sp.]|nr:hypothetical protein [Candidatus Angelobacter sp.]